VEFEELFRRNYEAVSRYVARRLPPDDVQDVVSETFIVAWRRRDELSGDPLPWLLGVARRVGANHRRGQARRGALNELLNAQPHKAAGVGPEHGARVLQALGTLPERDREALMLIAWDGLEHRAAASVMGCSTTAFTVRIHRARRRLQRALSADGQSPLTLNRQARSTS
jgi:RNA polymerase sigma-70 factor, ECF subfamily